MARQRRQDDDFFLVLGDLGDSRFIVRMFVGDATYDHEFKVPLAELGQAIQEKMARLKAKPDSELKVEAERPRHHPGHAIDVPL